MITGDESEYQEVLGKIVKLWVTIRGLSFTKLIVEKYRQATKKKTAKTKELKTKLFTDEFD